MDRLRPRLGGLIGVLWVLWTFWWIYQSLLLTKHVKSPYFCIPRLFNSSCPTSLSPSVLSLSLSPFPYLYLFLSLLAASLFVIAVFLFILLPSIQTCMVLEAPLSNFPWGGALLILSLCPLHSRCQFTPAAKLHSPRPVQPGQLR